ncbi:MAG: hypothetical protein QHJ73_12345, partial [Armatimonadota bacterium]|nr:hypothetical protein [Armatimonadota bacterium]
MDGSHIFPRRMRQAEGKRPPRSRDGGRLPRWPWVGRSGRASKRLVIGLALALVVGVVVAVVAARTGAGKSQTSRRLVSLLGQAGLQVVVVRHPMPYGDLA